MKKILVFAIAIVSAVSLNAQGTDPELDYIKKAYSKDKKMIVDEYMGLDVQEGAKFWPVYGAYEAKREKLAVERLKIIQTYVDNTDSLNAGVADKIANSALENNISLSKLNLEYYGKIKKAIGALRAAKFIQLETYLQTQWRGVIQDNIPFISELDKTQQN